VNPRVRILTDPCLHAHILIYCMSVGSGRKPLHYSAYEGRLVAVQWLLKEAKAEVDFKDAVTLPYNTPLLHSLITIPYTVW